MKTDSILNSPVEEADWLICLWRSATEVFEGYPVFTLSALAQSCAQVTYLLFFCVDYTIIYYSKAVQNEILALPDTLAARYIVLTRRMIVLGPNLGAPQTKAFGHGLFELRLKGVAGIARVFFCALVGQRIVMLHSFVKKSEKTPRREHEIAEARMKEVKRADT